MKKMNLSQPYFNMVKNGKKTVEIRLYDDKRKQLKIGDKIKFSNNEIDKSFFKKIKDIKIFESFRKAITQTRLKNCMPNINRIDDADTTKCIQIYTSSKIRNIYINTNI